MARCQAVLFDLLTALIDSWSLWDDVAGGVAAGRRWRGAYLQQTYGEGRYRPYEVMVCEAAASVGLPAGLGERLVERYAELRPWPEVGAVLGRLQGQVPLAVVTNCSEKLGLIAAAATGIAFDVVVTAERAGFYKPDPRAYRLGLDALGVAPAACLFVAGSSYDLVGAAAVGLPVFWHNRIGMIAPADAPPPLAEHATLHGLVPLVLG